ncbi:MAG: porin [Planctomycetaceae bacterium]|nr:porin [Planctomycetaceae bacterium]
MSRKSFALLGSAMLCAVILFGPPSHAALAQRPSQDADNPATPLDYQKLLERLEQAEAEIDGLKQHRPSPVDEAGYLGDEPGSGLPPSDGLAAQIRGLEKNFKEFKDGLSKKKYPNTELHGVVQADSGWYGQDQTNINEFGILKDGADFRRTRLSANGAIAPNVNYFVQMDFAFPGRPTFTDVWVEVTKLPVVGNLRVGQWKQPFSLEVVSSFRYTMLPERSLLFNAFTPFRHIAVGMYDYSEDERMTWAASVYRPGQDQYGGSIASSGGYAGVGRITGLPWYENDGASYLHLGAAYNYVAPNGRFGGFRSIPEFFIGQHDAAANGTAGTSTPTLINGTPFFVNTGNFFMNHYNLVGAEALWVEGPITVQSEFMYLNALRNTGVGANFAGFYTQMGYFLTGEHRPYNKKQGALDRIKVLHDFGNNDDCGHTWGGLEVASRVSYIDLNSRDIQGGREFNYTAGLNWYLNSYTKIQLEYIRADLINAKFGQSVTNLYDIRMQWDF